MAKKEKPATKICKHCKSEIPYDAKVCPNCRKKQSGGPLKWLVILLILIVLIAACSGAGNSGTKKVGEVSQNSQTAVTDSTQTAADSSDASDETGAADENSDEAAAENADSSEGSDAAANVDSGANEAENVQTVYHVGDILQDGNLEIVYMASGEYAEENEYLQPKDGYKYIYIQLAFENISDSDDVTVSVYSFEGYADGYSVDMYYGADDTLSSTLSAGRTVTGYLYFEVPTDAQDIEIEYETNVFTEDKITFVYEGEQDSGYVPEKNTEATEGALHVGDTTDTNALSITYTQCFTDDSGNQFITPKDGYHYVTCEFEFENISTSDQMVSFYDFDCFADGAACDAAYFRDDALSATISAGRKVKGTVTFEVPDDATTVEVEYLDNYWTSGRIAFTVAE